MKLLPTLCVLSCMAFQPQRAATAVAEASEQVGVGVGVFYESLCPCCQAFIPEQLLPAYSRAPELINLTLVPYGNAQTTKTSKGYEFVCQHGPKECQANKVHSCAIKYVKNKKQLLNFIACMISDETDPEAIGKECAHLSGISWKPILKCSRGPEGVELLKANGDLTAALGPEMEGVPAITFNGELGDQLAAIDNFWDELCKHFPDPKPKKCLESSRKTLCLRAAQQDGEEWGDHGSEEFWKEQLSLRSNKLYRN